MENKITENAKSEIEKLCDLTTNNILDIRLMYEELSRKYQELLYQVSIKHPGETRHETALRYIRQAEKSLNLSQCNSRTTKEAINELESGHIKSFASVDDLMVNLNED